MTYTDSFRTDVAELSRGYLKFIVSRTVSNPRDNILEAQVPANLPAEFTVEMSLYSVADDSLVYNIVYPSSQQSAFHLRTLQYANQEVRRFVFIDLSELQQNFPVGDFRLVMNFVADEVGTAAEPLLEVVAISPSRQEIELQLLPQYDTTDYQNILMEFARPRVTSQWVKEVITQIFGMDVSSPIPSDNTVLDTEDISALFPSGLNGVVLSELDVATQSILETAQGLALKKIDGDMTAGKQTFTNVYLKEVVYAAIRAAYTSYTQQEQRTQTKAKYSLSPLAGTEL